MAQHFVEVFGSELVVAGGSVKTAEALKDKVVAIYFSAHWCPPCRGFTPQLADWYTKSLAAKGLEVIFVSSDKNEESFAEYFAAMPWKALPYADRDRKAALSKKFKVQGIPTLVILDTTGDVITRDGRSAVSNDPSGEEFPWRPKPFAEVLGASFTGRGGAQLDKSAVEGKVLGLYFSAHWCPPCRAFTPQLASWYEAVTSSLPNFEIIFVSSDQTEAGFEEYFAEMPWIALPYAERKRKEELSERFGVDGIPTLVIVDKDGSTITSNGRSIPEMDPEGKQFPWHPKPVQDLAHDIDGIQDYPSLVVMADGADETTRNFIESAILSVASEFKAKAKETGSDEMKFFIGGPSAKGILRRIRSLTKQPVVVEKHEHALERNPVRQNWECDGCGETSEEGAAYCCGPCNFDLCEDCNGKVVEKHVYPVGGVLLDLSDEGAYYLCDGVDFTSATSIRDHMNQFRAGGLSRLQA